MGSASGRPIERELDGRATLGKGKEGIGKGSGKVYAPYVFLENNVGNTILLCGPCRVYVYVECVSKGISNIIGCNLVKG